MTIAVLSGKGGTGKTLLAVNLAYVEGNSTYIDCDVEEPNGHLFFKPTNVTSEDIAVKIPTVDMSLCDGCRKCVQFCNFNALAYAGSKLIIYDKICHSCGGCSIVCPQNALSEIDKSIGRVDIGTSGLVKVCSGFLNPSEASGIPIITRLLKEVDKAKSTFIDCPPGSACIVMESIKDADYCVLVAEPTIFGVHNLSMVFDLVKLFDKKFGVVLNKCMDNKNPSEEFCLQNNIDILGKIDYNSKLGLHNSNAEIVSSLSGEYSTIFADLLKAIKRAM